ncbi:thiol reductant ABC exporter subunit CydD [Mesorhizobium sp. SP-1A]|uniref:thiol reductant ABC exporter subunit CydD n=1 Tax=Mesorhizobium sp. SP-1A TaxID=3077840 RepID=UPI0028F73E62|nr:thiol reductant ABC exporter subunit CydD [Mesorhizobium sp. SP-1A]
MPVASRPDRRPASIPAAMPDMVSLETAAKEKRAGTETGTVAPAPFLGSRAAAWLQIAASLVFIPQAAAICAAVGAIAVGGGLRQAIWPAALVAVLGIVKALLEAAGSRMAFRSARARLSELRARATLALSAASPLDTGRPSSGQAASVLAEQAEAVVAYLARFRPARLRATVVPLVILAIVFAVSWLAALVLLLAAPLIPIFMAMVGWRAKEASERQLGKMGSMNAFLLDRLRGIATIRSLGAVDATAERVRAEAEGLRRRTMAVLRIAFLSSAVLELFAALGVAMVAVYVGFHLLGQIGFGAWGARLSLGEGLFVLLLAPAFFEPLRELSAAWHDRAAGEAAIEALERLADRQTSLPGADDEVRHTVPVLHAAPAVRINGLSYRHPDRSQWIFDGFDLAITPGEHVALLAPSGVGKSTLLALVAGLASPQAGRIVIGGTPMDQAHAMELRRCMGWIGQAPHIFAGTLAANVSLGRPQVSAGDVADALGAMGLAHVRDRAAMAVGEAGAGLSGGETLRLALARVAATPDATLILADEPTAHLDSGTGREIIASLLELARGKTLIVATHDPALAARMDRVIRLESSPLERAA